MKRQIACNKDKNNGTTFCKVLCETSQFNSQHLQVGEAAKSSVCNEADAVVSDLELVKDAEAYEAGFLQSGQMVEGEVAAAQTTKNVLKRAKGKNCRDQLLQQKKTPALFLSKLR